MWRIALVLLSAVTTPLPAAVDVANTLRTDGVAITSEVTDSTSVVLPAMRRASRRLIKSKAYTATSNADVDVTVYKSTGARERAQLQRQRSLVAVTTEPGVLPLTATATCGPILVEVSDGERRVDPGPVAAQVQAVLASRYGLCPDPSPAFAKAQADASTTLCGLLLNAGILQVESILAYQEALSLGATMPIADAWRAAVMKVGTASVSAPLAALTAACRALP